MVEQSTAASHSLAKEADELSALVARFKVDAPNRNENIVAQQRRLAAFAARGARAVGA
jgi:hypothetical protein